MGNEVSQWLAEIQSLQEQVKTVAQERDQAYASAANWRRLYEAEAEQRRADSERGQLQIRALTNEIAALKQGVLATGSSPELEQVLAQVDRAQSVDELRTQLVEALTLCDQLSATLQQEKSAHAETKESLTSALGDTIDLLSKQSAARPSESSESAP